MPWRLHQLTGHFALTQATAAGHANTAALQVKRGRGPAVTGPATHHGAVMLRATQNRCRSHMGQGTICCPHATQPRRQQLPGGQGRLAGSTCGQGRSVAAH